MCEDVPLPERMSNWYDSCTKNREEKNKQTSGLPGQFVMERKKLKKGKLKCS